MLPEISLNVLDVAENSVKAGATCVEIDVTVSAANSQLTIRIADNGVGFDPTEKRDEKHIGIANAKARLMLLCAGTLSVTSQRGQGAVCEIRIPKGEKKA